MARIIPLRNVRTLGPQTPGPQTQGRIVYFSRRDLQHLLGLFSRHVQARQWLDYSIDNDERAAVFCVYRRAHDAPLYKIYRLAASPSGKNGGKGNAGGLYLVMKGARRLIQSADLEAALRIFAPPLRVVESRRE